jgi:hypothetical protein
MGSRRIAQFIWEIDTRQCDFAVAPKYPVSQKLIRSGKLDALPLQESRQPAKRLGEGQTLKPRCEPKRYWPLEGAVARVVGSVVHSARSC